MVTVTINRDECVSCGTCVDVCPAFFELSADDTRSQVCEPFRNEGRLEEGEAPPELEACVIEAADLCPVQVIMTG